MKAAFETLIWLIITTAPVLAGQGSIQPITSTKHDSALPALNDAGQGAINAREMRVDFLFPSGRSGKGGFLVLFDSATGYFIWRGAWTNQVRQTSMMADFSPGSTVYVAQDRIVLFEVDRFLTIRESRERARDLNDAESKALQTETNYLAETEGRAKNSRPPVVVDLMYVAGRNFLTPPLSSAPSGPVKLVSVSRVEGKWVLVLQAQWKAKMVLDDKFGRLCKGCGAWKID